MNSSMLNRRRKPAAIPAQSAPAARATTIARGIMMAAGRSQAMPNAATAIAPIRNWPGWPRFTQLLPNPTAAERPVRMSGVALFSVDTIANLENRL